MEELKHFVEIKVTVEKGNKIGVAPVYVYDSNDIMNQGGHFYAVYDKSSGMWKKDMIEVLKTVDRDVKEYIKKKFVKDGYGTYRTKEGNEVVGHYIRGSVPALVELNRWITNLPNDFNSEQLDTQLTFKSDKVTLEDYRSKRLPYDLKEESTEAYDALMDVLYSPEERQKLEWAIGCILSGESVDAEKMVVLYGTPGSGKSTVLDIIKAIFKGYWEPFDANDLSSGGNFATAMFKDNPLVAIHDDGKLVKLESPIINEIISHKTIIVNEKNKRQYTMRPNSMLFVATNSVVDLNSSKVGLARRLIDVYPSKRKVEVGEYRKLVKKIHKFEIPGIAYKCLQVYNKLGIDYYEDYRPEVMIRKADYIRNFLFDSLEDLKEDCFYTRSALYLRYKKYVEDNGLGNPPKVMAFGDELVEYFDEYWDSKAIDGKNHKHVYRGIKVNKVCGIAEKPVALGIPSGWIEFKEQPSILDRLYSDCPAQYTREDGIPETSWEKCTTTLKDIDTHRLHYVLLPNNVVRIDFDKTNANGEKDLKLNIEEANKFPRTYAEVSKSGGGIHLYYIWEGDLSELQRFYEERIEIKYVEKGKNTSRRKLTLCNNEKIAIISYGLPLKEKKRGENVFSEEVVTTERGLRTTIKRCLNKEIHPDTTSNIHWIKKILDQAYEQGLEYDVSDLYPDVYLFASNSTHHSEEDKELVREMHFKSEVVSEPDSGNYIYTLGDKTGQLVFYDIEVAPNLLLLCYKYYKVDKVVRLFNPTPMTIARFFDGSMIVGGFNNRGYDDHILYGRMVGDSIPDCYNRSQAIISSNKKDKENEPERATFSKAYRLADFDIFDISDDKMSLKKWEIELKLPHKEWGRPWDEPVPEDKWEEFADYCCNDVMATEAVFDHIQDQVRAREVLAKMSGRPIIDSTRQHITAYLFGNDPKPPLVYTNLATGQQWIGRTHEDEVPYISPTPHINKFPGYKFDPKGFDVGDYIYPPVSSHPTAIYMGEDPSNGGYVFSRPGVYPRVVSYDVSGMHSANIIALDKFGPATPRYAALKYGRDALKHNDIEKAKLYLPEDTWEYLTGDTKAFSKAVKLILNTTYGIGFTSFESAIRDPRDVDNIVAKRGALFIITLKNEVEKRGFKVVHCKTDSIKVVEPTPEIEQFIFDFGHKYSYEFEVEYDFQKFCLVNKSVFIAKEQNGTWLSKGAEFAHPYVFKTLFTGEDIIFDDLCEVKNVTSEMYLDLNESLPEEEHNYQFIGRTGLFCPVNDGAGGGELLRKKGDKYYAVTGTKGFRFLESETVKAMGKQDQINELYFQKLVEQAIKDIEKVGDFKWLVS